MKKMILVLVFTQLSLLSFSQLVARAEIKEKIDGVCDIKNVYTLFPMFGDQKEAISNMSDSAITAKLLTDVTFLSDKPKYNDKGMVSILINCKGEVVKCEIDNKSKSADLDEQVLKVFKTVTFSKAGTLNGRNVDSMRLWSYNVKKGKISID
ncbi:MAG TPA: hypothetical protein VKH37_12270 [Ferruginibacter sp.]|nr:hypothetical protein [Ferruginibacter sp.]